MRLRPILALILSAILSLTALSVGAARGQADPAGAIVICSGHGAVTVYVDDSGQPVPAPHICPDCVLFLAALPVAREAAPEVLRPARIVPVSPLVLQARAALTAAKARAPPAGRLQ